MLSKILFKRGDKATLPTLDVGEPGFSVDTKELFIGSSTGNVVIGGSQSVNPNLLINGNVIPYDGEFNKTLVWPNKGKYFAGCYCVLNSSSEDVMVTNQSSSQGFLRFGAISTGASSPVFSLRYRIPIPTGFNSGLYWLTGKTVTLSFDCSLAGAGGIPIQFKCGCRPNNLVLGTIPNSEEITRISKTFTIEPITIPANTFEVVLFETYGLSNTTTFLYDLRLGNFKMELGTEATPFFPSDPAEDLNKIDRFRTKGVYEVRTNIITENTISCYAPITYDSAYVPFATTVDSLSIKNTGGTYITGFTSSISRRSNTLVVIATKNPNHGITGEAIMAVGLTIDYRQI